jgi:hypothetical protein
VRFLIALLALSLGACAADQARPDEPRTQTVEIKVPVAVPCFDEKDRPIPPQPTPIDLEHATTDQLAAALAADHEADELYMRQIEALFIQCQQKAGKEIR